MMATDSNAAMLRALFRKISIKSPQSGPIIQALLESGVCTETTDEPKII